MPQSKALPMCQSSSARRLHPADCRQIVWQQHDRTSKPSDSFSIGMIRYMSGLFFFPLRRNYQVQLLLAVPPLRDCESSNRPELMFIFKSCSILFGICFEIFGVGPSFGFVLTLLTSCRCGYREYCGTCKILR